MSMAKVTLRDTLFKGITQAPGECVALRWWPNKDDPRPTEMPYSELLCRVRRLAQAIVEEGCQGRRVAIAMDDSGTSIMALLAILYTNCAAVLLAPHEPPEGVAEKLWRTDAALLLCDASFAHKVAERSVPVWSFDKVASILENDRACGIEDANQVAARHAGEEALLIFTSGTTGKDKCVVRTDHNLAFMLENRRTESYYGLDQLLILPSYHVFSVDVLIVPTLFMGWTLTIGRGSQHLVEELRRYGAVDLMCVPAQADLLAQSLTPKDAKDLALRNIYSGGAATSQETIDALSALGITCASGYGCSEAGAPVSLPKGEALDAVPMRGSAGYIMPYLEYAVRDPDPEGFGELLLRGPSVASHYLSEQRRYVPIMDADGWLATGDIARVDHERRLYLRGRKKELIILASGENVSSEELEGIFGAVEGVRECQALEWREQICLLVVPHNDGCDLTTLAGRLQEANAQLPSWKRVGAFYRCEALERTPTGKIRRTSAPEPKEDERIWLPGERADASGVASAQEAVLAAFRRALGNADVQLDDDFFALGGDSLGAMAIVAHLCDAGYRVSIPEVFANPTCADLAALLARDHEAPLQAGRPLEPCEDTLPLVDQLKSLSERQDEVEAAYPARGAWHEDLVEDARIQRQRGGFFMDQLFVLKEPLDEASFVARVREIVSRHPVLRSKWVKESDGWFQVVLRHKDVVARYVDLCGHVGGAAQRARLMMADYQARYAERLQEELPEPFGVWCYRLSEDTCALLVELTHSYVDGYSAQLLFKELVAGPDPSLVDRFHDYQRWLVQRRHANIDDAKAYWARFDQRMAAEHYEMLPSKGDGSMRRMSQKEVFSIRMDLPTCQRIAACARTCQVTPVELMSYAWYRAEMSAFGIDHLLFRDYFLGRECQPFDMRGTVAFTVCMAPFHLDATDTLLDYHARLMDTARFVEPAVQPLFQKWRGMPVALNKRVYGEPLDDYIRSMSRPIPVQDVWYAGFDIVAIDLSRDARGYRIDVRHARDDQAQQTLRRLEAAFWVQLNKLLEKDGRA